MGEENRKKTAGLYVGVGMGDRTKVALAERGALVSGARAVIAVDAATAKQCVFIIIAARCYCCSYAGTPVFTHRSFSLPSKVSVFCFFISSIVFLFFFFVFPT